LLLHNERRFGSTTLAAAPFAQSVVQLIENALIGHAMYQLQTIRDVR